MGKKDVFTKILALTGSFLVWVPLLSPVIFSLVLFPQRRFFRFDYLMPAELFPLALLGGGLLVWASRRARIYARLIAWACILAVVILFAGQAIAVVSGLASGATEPVGLVWGLVVLSLVLYILALIVMGVGGVLLALALIKHDKAPGNSLSEGV